MKMVIRMIRCNDNDGNGDDNGGGGDDCNTFLRLG